MARSASGGFHGICAALAKGGWKAVGQVLASYSKAGPKHPGRAAANAGCFLLFPFVSLLVWTIQAILLVVVAIPFAAWALLWSLLALVSTPRVARSRESRSPSAAQRSPESEGAPPPSPA